VDCPPLAAQGPWSHCRRIYGAVIKSKFRMEVRRLGTVCFNRWVHRSEKAHGSQKASKLVTAYRATTCPGLRKKASMKAWVRRAAGFQPQADCSQGKTSSSARTSLDQGPASSSRAFSWPREGRAGGFTLQAFGSTRARPLALHSAIAMGRRPLLTGRPTRPKGRSCFGALFSPTGIVRGHGDPTQRWQILERILVRPRL